MAYIVTGGSSGIGEAVIKGLCEQGKTVYNLDIKPGRFGEFIYCDLLDKESVATAFEQIQQDHETIDGLVSNAGIHVSATLEQTDDSLFEQVINLNVRAAFWVTQLVLPLMKVQNKGAIVYVASDQALIAKPNSFVYNLSKHALASMAKTTALDYAAYQIRANAVCPGTIDTPLYQMAINDYCQRSGEDEEQVHQEEAAQQPLGRIGQPEEVAALVLFLLSDKAQFITGSLQLIDGGYTCR